MMVLLEVFLPLTRNFGQFTGIKMSAEHKL